VIIATSVTAVIVLMTRRRRQAQEDDLKQAASSRGWTFATSRENGYRVQRWTGTTDGIAWVAESLRQAAGGNKNSNRKRHISRWRATYSPGVNGTIVCMGVPKGKEPIAGSAHDQGFLAQLARKAANFAFDGALDTYFGEPGKAIDVAAMHRVETQHIPGYVVMAADKDEAARVLGQGLERTLVEATNDRTSVLAEDNRPWILVQSNTVALARLERHRNATDVDRFVRAGVALTHGFRR